MEKGVKSKVHPLKGRKQSPEQIAKRMATIAEVPAESPIEETQFSIGPDEAALIVLSDGTVRMVMPPIMGDSKEWIDAKAGSAATLAAVIAYLISSSECDDLFSELARRWNRKGAPRPHKVTEQ
jgi:hypothetical protein